MQGRKEEKIHCNIPCYIQTELLSLVPRLKAGFSINERNSFSASSVCQLFDLHWTTTELMTFGHERAWRWQPSCPFPRAPAARHRALQLSQPCQGFFPVLPESWPRDLHSPVPKRPGQATGRLVPLGARRPGKPPSSCENETLPLANTPA